MAGVILVFFISVAFKWHRHAVKKYCQGCDFSKLPDEKTATSCEGERAHGGRCLHPGGEGLLPALSFHRRFPAYIPA